MTFDLQTFDLQTLTSDPHLQPHLILTSDYKSIDEAPPKILRSLETLSVVGSTWLHQDKHETLYDLLEHFKPSLILEVGTYVGHFAELVLRQNPSATVVSVDPMIGVSEGFALDRDRKDARVFEQDLLVVNRLRMSTRSNLRQNPLIKLPYSDFLRSESDFQPDLIYIDGAHDFASAEHDISQSHIRWPEVPLVVDDTQLEGVRKALQNATQITGRKLYIMHKAQTGVLFPKDL